MYNLESWGVVWVCFVIWFLFLFSEVNRGNTIMSTTLSWMKIDFFFFPFKQLSEIKV